MVEIANTSSPRRTHLHHHRRWIPSFLTTHKTLLVSLWIAFLFTLFLWQQRSAAAGFLIFRRPFPYRPFPKLRPVAFNLTDFGAVGDGVTINTVAFERAMMAISKLGKKGGGQLNVPSGNWLTAPFNLTSHMTLFLAEGAEILGINVSNNFSCFFTFLGAADVSMLKCRIFLLSNQELLFYSSLTSFKTSCIKMIEYQDFFLLFYI